MPFYLRTGKRVAQHLTHDRDSLPPVGYEKLLYHSTLGNALLFQGADMVEASWAALQPVLDVWESSEDVPARYTAGSDGAAAAVEMLARSGHGWLPLEHPAERSGQEDLSRHLHPIIATARLTQRDDPRG